MKLIKSKNFFQIPFEKKWVKEITTETGSNAILFEWYASTRDKDRVNDVVLPKAFQDAMNDYMNNPILLLQHNPEKPIWTILEAKINNKWLYVKAQVTEDTDWVFSKLKNWVLKAMSIWYRIKPNWFEEKEVVDENWNISYETIIKDLDLYEISLVSVPANQNALIKSDTKLINKEDFAKYYQLNYQFTNTLTKSIENCFSKENEETEEEIEKIKNEQENNKKNDKKNEWDSELENEDNNKLDEDDNNINEKENNWDLKNNNGENIEDKEKEIENNNWEDEEIEEISGEEVEEKSVVAFKPYTTADEWKAWNWTAAKRRIRDWSTNEDDEIDYWKYKEWFAWFDSENSDNLWAYKLPHHDIMDWEIETIRRWVASAMAALLWARWWVDIPDDEKSWVYNHLRKHYEQFDKEVPELKLYTNEELEKMFWNILIKEDEEEWKENDMENEEKRPSKYKQATTIQTLIFNKSYFSREEAKDWAKSHWFKYWEVEETDFEFKLKQRSMEDFVEKSFKNIPITKWLMAKVWKLIEWQAGLNLDIFFDTMIKYKAEIQKEALEKDYEESLKENEIENEDNENEKQEEEKTLQETFDEWEEITIKDNEWDNNKDNEEQIEQSENNKDQDDQQSENSNWNVEDNKETDKESEKNIIGWDLKEMTYLKIIEQFEKVLEEKDYVFSKKIQELKNKNEERLQAIEKKLSDKLLKGNEEVEKGLYELTETVNKSIEFINELKGKMEKYVIKKWYTYEENIEHKNEETRLWKVIKKIQSNI